MLKSWIHSSVATLEAHESENWIETKCYKHRRNSMELLSEWFLTTHMAATTPRISIFTLSMPKNRAFYQMVPMFASLFLGDGKKINKRFSPM